MMYADLLRSRRGGYTDNVEVECFRTEPFLVARGIAVLARMMS